MLTKDQKRYIETISLSKMVRIYPFDKKTQEIAKEKLAIHEINCIFIFLDRVQKIKPFEIDKTGFGAMAAWLIVDDLEKIKKPAN